MKNYLFNQTALSVKSTKTTNCQHLSDDAFYLIALISQLKKMLGPVAQQYFPVSGVPVAFNKNVL